jgi:hypothetical protein
MSARLQAVVNVVTSSNFEIRIHYKNVFTLTATWCIFLTLRKLFYSRLLFKLDSKSSSVFSMMSKHSLTWTSVNSFVHFFLPKKYQLLFTCGLYYKHILTILSDDHKWCLYYKCFISFALALASVVNYAHKWRHSLERHLLMTLESSFTIVICL